MALAKIQLRLKTEAIRKKLLIRRGLLGNSPANCNDFFANCCNCCGSGTGTGTGTGTGFGTGSGGCLSCATRCGDCCIPNTFTMKSNGDTFGCISSSFTATMINNGGGVWTGSGTDGAKTFNLTVTCTNGIPILSVTCSGSGNSSGDFILFGTPIVYSCNYINWGGNGTLCGCSSTGYDFYTNLDSCCPPTPGTLPPTTITANDGTNSVTLTWNNDIPPTWSGSATTFVGCSPAFVQLVCQPQISYLAVNADQFFCSPSGSYYPVNLSTCTSTSGCDSNSYTLSFSSGVGFISAYRRTIKNIMSHQNCCDDINSENYSFDIPCPFNSNILEASGTAIKTIGEVADTYVGTGLMKCNNLPCEGSEYTLIYTCNKDCQNSSNCCWDVEAISINCIEGASCNVVECDCQKSPKFKFEVSGNNFNCGCCSNETNNS